MLGFSPLSSTPLAVSPGPASVNAIVTIGGVSATASVAPVYAYFTPLIFILAGGAGYTGINIAAELGSITVTVSSVISAATDLRKPEGYAYSVINGVGDMRPLDAPDRRYFFQLGTGNTGGLAGNGPSLYEASLVEIGTLELNSSAVLSYMDNSVTLTGLSASPSLVTTNISAIVGQFRSVSGFEVVSSQGQLGNTGYHYLLKPEGVSGTVSFGIPVGKVVYLARLQTEAPYNHDQEATVSLGAVAVAVANQAPITLSQITTASLNNVATLVNAKPTLSGLTEYTTFSDPRLRLQLNSLSSSTTLIGTLALSDLDNSSVQKQLTDSFPLTVSTNIYWTLNNSHPDLVAEDSLKATVSLGQLANQSPTEEVNLPAITSSLGLISTISQNIVPVSGQEFTVGLGNTQANVLEPLTSSFLSNASLGSIATLATSFPIIHTGLEITLGSNLTTEVTTSGTAFPVGQLLSGSAGNVSVTASSTITLPSLVMTIYHGGVSFTALNGQYLELFLNPNVTATGVTFDYEAIKHLYNPARSSFPLPVSRTANVTEVHPRKIAA